MADARSDTKKSLAQNWMGQFGIKDGEYLSMTKAQLRTQQRPDRPLKVQVWATGMLHTAGYQGEVAMTMRNKKQVPLAPNDIIKELYAAAVKYFRDGGIQASDAELEKLRETKETIRRALSALEEDGVCQRTDDQGRLLSDLSDAESRKLGNGKIRLCFFLRPKSATAKTVEQDWRERGVKAQEATVDEIRLLTPPIWKILNIFQIEKPGKATLSNAEFQQRVNHAYESAKKVFLNEISVDIECPPSAVDTPCPPKVDTPGGTLERNIERNVQRVPVQAAGSETTDESSLPPALIYRELARRKLGAGHALVQNIVDTLGSCPPSHFLDVLDRRAARGAIGTGLLLYIAEDAAREFSAICSSVDEAEASEQARAKAFEKRTIAASIELARKVLASPHEYSAIEIEWANEFLSQQGAA